MGGEGGGHVSDLSGPGTYIINGVSVSANAFYMQLEIGTGGFGGDFGTWTASGSGMSVASYDYGVVGYEQFGGAVCSDSCDGSGTPDEIAYPIYGLIGETFSDSGGAGGVLMAANNGPDTGLHPTTVDKYNPMERGKTSLRDSNWFCSTHVTIDQTTGQTASHVDLFNPEPTQNQASPTLFWLHFIYDGTPDFIYRKTGTYLVPAGRGICQ
jgi:hypothetical protein